jgi:hypothetical protein
MASRRGRPIGFEHRREPLLPRPAFLLRLFRRSAAAGGLVLGSLGAGVLGYHQIAGLPWIDALLNASMILTGMGPVDPMKTDASKLFASAYALFSGMVFLTAAAVVFAPILHRLLHRFHLEAEDEAERGGKR